MLLNANFLIALREGLEVSLVIGFLLVSLVQNKKQYLIKSVISGTIFGSLFSLFAGILLYLTIGGLEGTVEQYVEGGIQLVASLLIFYFVFWLSGQNNENLSDKLKSEVTIKDNSVSLFLMASVFVIREGLEIVLFSFSNIHSHAMNNVISIVLGIVVAIAITYVLIRTTINLNIKLIFTLLGILLIFFGANVFTEGLSEFLNTGPVFEKIAFYCFATLSFFVLFKNTLIAFVQRKK